jgi:acyl carrier protein
MSDIRTQIRTFLADDLSIDMSQVVDSEPLFTSGLIDSYSLIELLSFLESDIGFVVDFAELNVDDFDTIDSLVSLVTQKTA